MTDHDKFASPLAANGLKSKPSNVKVFTKHNSMGRQPLDELMTRLGLSNADLVRASKEQLTHKMVNRGRKGRLLTLNVQLKILNAMKAARPEENSSLGTLFNYRGHE